MIYEFVLIVVYCNLSLLYVDFGLAAMTGGKFNAASRYFAIGAMYFALMGMKIISI